MLFGSYTCRLLQYNRCNISSNIGCSSIETGGLCARSCIIRHFPSLLNVFLQPGNLHLYLLFAVLSFNRCSCLSSSCSTAAVISCFSLPTMYLSTLLYDSLSRYSFCSFLLHIFAVGSFSGVESNSSIPNSIIAAATILASTSVRKKRQAALTAELMSPFTLRRLIRLRSL